MAEDGEILVPAGGDVELEEAPGGRQFEDACKIMHSDPTTASLLFWESIHAHYKIEESLDHQIRLLISANLPMHEFIDQMVAYQSICPLSVLQHLDQKLLELCGSTQGNDLCLYLIQANLAMSRSLRSEVVTLTNEIKLLQEKKRTVYSDPELLDAFYKAVEAVGIDKATQSEVREMMGGAGEALTLEQVSRKLKWLREKTGKQKNDTAGQ